MDSIYQDQKRRDHLTVSIHERIALSVLYVAVFVGVFAPLAAAKIHTPEGTTYYSAKGYTPDYYQYISYIKRGMMGEIFLDSAYVQKPQQKSLILPMFSLAGYVGRFFPMSSFDIYLVLRFVAMVVFLVTWYILLKHVIHTAVLRTAAIFLFTTSGGGWYFQDAQQIVEAVPWSSNFNVIGKFTLPPHHLFGLSILTILIWAFPKPKVSVSLGILLGFLSPAFLILFYFYIAATMVILLIRRSAERIKFMKQALLFISCTIPLLIYDMYLFRNVSPWSVMYTLMRKFNPNTSLLSYVVALGPLLPLSLAAFSRKFFSTSTHVFLASWAFLPLILFPFAGSAIPINTSRLFQSYQFVPMAILATFGIHRITQKLHRVVPQHILFVFIVALVTLYGAIPYITTLLGEMRPQNLNIYNVYIPNPAVNAFGFLETKTKPDSVVLSGEYMSQMIPAFTHNRTVLGRDDTAADYYEKLSPAIKFLNGAMEENEARVFLEHYNVSYILFGVDTFLFENLELKNYPYLREVFRDGGVTVVNVAI